MGTARQPLSPEVTARERRPELIRPEDRRRQFPEREAQRRLREKEVAWAPVAYGVFLAAILVIFAFAYVSYAFSRYRDVILPGVHIDQVDVSGMSAKQAEKAIGLRESAVGWVPVLLTYGSSLQWRPTRQDIGFSPRIHSTVAAAMKVGRSETFVEQLVDRLPLHPSHSVPLQYSLTPPTRLRQYVVNDIARGGPNRQGLYSPPRNAQLKIDSSHDWHVYLSHARPGTNLDVNGTVTALHNALGSLRRIVIPLQVSREEPQVTDADAHSVQARVERFLAHPPILNIGKRVIVTTRATFGPMFSFSEPASKGHTAIKLNVDSGKINSYVASLASGVDRAPQNARLQFTGAQVQVVSPKRTGRTMDQSLAVAALSRVVTSLKPNARLHFKVKVTQPPIDMSNPASVGINTLLATGRSSFTNGTPTRLNDITSIAHTLNGKLIPPGGDISFNYLVGVDWDNRVYNDLPVVDGSTLEPGDGGAMQQVATSFLRAMYWSGLPILERHAHTYRLPWYEPPIGLDAVVAPGRNWDLRFQNTTHHYLLLETDVQPISQEITVYVYGPHLGWHVSVGGGTVTKTYPHGTEIVRRNSALGPGNVRHLAFADDGAATTVHRTVTLPGGVTRQDQLNTVYQPSQAILEVGTQPTPTPTTTPNPTPGTVTPTVQPTGTASPSPTPTFNH